MKETFYALVNQFAKSKNLFKEAFPCLQGYQSFFDTFVFLLAFTNCWRRKLVYCKFKKITKLLNVASGNLIFEILRKYCHQSKVTLSFGFVILFHGISLILLVQAPNKMLISSRLMLYFKLYASVVLDESFLL